MSITEGTTSIQLTKTRRTWRTQIESADNQPVHIEAFRQIQSYGPDSKLFMSEGADVIHRTLTPEIAAELVTLASGKVLTVGEVAEAISKKIDEWDLIDRTPAVSQ